MRLILLLVVLSLSGLLAVGVIELMGRTTPAERVYDARLSAPCLKCGLKEIKPRYCMDRCVSPAPTLDPLKRGAPVVWGREHIHRVCGSCGFQGDILECIGQKQP